MLGNGRHDVNVGSGDESKVVMYHCIEGEAFAKERAYCSGAVSPSAPPPSAFSHLPISTRRRGGEIINNQIKIDCSTANATASESNKKESATPLSCQ